MKKGCWKDSEVKDLFYTVETQKQNNKPLKQAFIAHALKYKRKPNSVRNYYYFQLDQLKYDIAKTKKLGIDLKQHEKLEIEYFSKDQEDKLIKQIEQQIKEGSSIRKACFNLSGGDLNLMLRYQNKYRNYIAKKTQTKLPDNVITFHSKKKASLSDSDINSLFLGLVRLVKRSAIDEFAEKSKEQLAFANTSLRKALVDLNKKEKELDKLKEDFVKLKLENSRLVQNMIKLKCEKASKIGKKTSENLF